MSYIFTKVFYWCHFWPQNDQMWVIIILAIWFKLTLIKLWVEVFTRPQSFWWHPFISIWVAMCPQMLIDNGYFNTNFTSLIQAVKLGSSKLELTILFSVFYSLELGHFNCQNLMISIIWTEISEKSTLNFILQFPCCFRCVPKK